MAGFRRFLRRSPKGFFEYPAVPYCCSADDVAYARLPSTIEQCSEIEVSFLGSFFVETLDPVIWQVGPAWLLKPLQRVVVIRRRREVIAQSGFTRFDALAPDEDVEWDIGVERAALARALTGCRS